MKCDNFLIFKLCIEQTEGGDGKFLSLIGFENKYFLFESNLLRLVVGFSYYQTTFINET